MKFPRTGFWMSTYSGKRVYFLDPKPEDFCIEDIAHGLSNETRYNGQCLDFYSCAEHSVRGALRATNPETALEFLLHDAAEAFCKDVVSPLVRVLPEYAKVRHNIQTVIRRKWNLPEHKSFQCNEIDQRMLTTECAIMFAHDDKFWTEPGYAPPYPDEWNRARGRERTGEGPDTPQPVAHAIDMQFWTPRFARRQFMAMYASLMNGKELP